MWPTLTEGMNLACPNRGVCTGSSCRVPIGGQQGCMAALTVTCTPASPCALVAL